MVSCSFPFCDLLQAVQYVFGDGVGFLLDGWFVSAGCGECAFAPLAFAFGFPGLVEGFELFAPGGVVFPFLADGFGGFEDFAGGGHASVVDVVDPVFDGFFP
ncbi:hypothetical protein C3E79_10290 [Corynebacterium liangguodongii]|uniref:Uncharacterized protein n=1 Tax=Corynebacterium liangguodongii TaxID=2079535 RepID=A0A2S0WGG1_9CORY|nr:hypothetical protein C3E79_10290 [Corynebacterium liangguodongii]PWB99173.1 hypothetical protein DF219_07905 [Corynebacterium liangguodongii]